MNLPSVELLNKFAIDGELLGVESLKRGHINDTFVSMWRGRQGVSRYVHQRVNKNVFPDPELVMRNIVVVTDHLATKLGRGISDPDTEDCALTLVLAKNGEPWVIDPSGEYWRTYPFIDRTRCVDVCSSPSIAFEAGAAFGRFLNQVSDIPSEMLREPIYRFQDSTYRFEQLEEAIALDPISRVDEVQEEVNFAKSFLEFVQEIKQGESRGDIVRRITHGDPKINNVLLSELTGRGVCIVDLDTCMPGTIVYDFGDLCRTSSIRAAEDEKDLSLVKVDLDLFAGVAEGFLPNVASTLSDFEREVLYLAPRLLTLTIGVRFLTDYINGDKYFRIHHPTHNLDRARTQFQGVRSMCQQGKEMQEVVRSTLQRL